MLLRKRTPHSFDVEFVLGKLAGGTSRVEKPAALLASTHCVVHPQRPCDGGPGIAGDSLICKILAAEHCLANEYEKRESLGRMRRAEPCLRWLGLLPAASNFFSPSPSLSPFSLVVVLRSLSGRALNHLPGAGAAAYGATP